jgi:hypothetical protein
MNEHVDAAFEEHAPQAALAVVDNAALCLPALSAKDAKEAMRKYQEICEAVLTPDDYQTFMQWDPAKRCKVEKRFKKKSAVKKLQTFWNVSVKVHDIVRDDLGDGHFGFRCTATATNNAGREVQATGACSTFEERFDVTQRGNEDSAAFAARAKAARARSYHDVLSTAETRASNRATMNCIGVGGGEVTADEVRPEPRRSNAAPEPSFEDAQAEWDARQKAAPKTAPKAVNEVAKAAFDLAVQRGVVPPGEKKMFMEWKEQHYPGAEWRDVLATLQAVPQPEVTQPEPKATVTHEPLTREKMEKRVFALCTKLKIGEDARHELTARLYARMSIKDLTDEQVLDLGDYLEAQPKAHAA